MQAPGQSQSPALTRLHRIRIRGPYEEWLARAVPPAPLDGLVMARFPHPDRPDPEALGKRLAAAAAAAKQVEHHAVLHCHGTTELEGAGVAQLLELHTGLDLETLFNHLRTQRAQLPVPLAVWLLRNAAEGVAHAHTMGVVHGSLSPSLVALLPEGALKVDFGLAGGAGAVDDATLTDLVDLRYTRPEWTVSEHPRIPEMDVWALGAMLLEAVAGEPPRPSFEDAQPVVNLDKVPEPLRAPLGAALALEGAACSATDLAAHLARIFYKTLGADDERDGRVPLLRWLERAGGTDPAVAEALDENADTIYPSAPAGPSEFTQALEARAGPVEPKDLSTDDFGVEPSGPDWSGPPPAQGGAPPPTEAVASEHGVSPDAAPTAHIISTPDVEAGALLAPELPMPSPSSTSTAPQSVSSISDLELRRPSRLTWFLTGFACTLVLLVALRFWVSGGGL